MTPDEVLLSQLEETRKFITSRYPHQPEVGIILGSGLGNLTSGVQIECSIAYEEIPHFPVSTVEGHAGSLLFGTYEGRRIVILSGRFHLYEGYSPQQVVFPIRTLKWIGVHSLMISNAAGGMNPAFRIGDIMVIEDHISLFSPNPLLGPNASRVGVRFPDMSEPYSKRLIEKMVAIAARKGIGLHRGVYVGVTGPTFETRAEYKMLRILGADAVGMSTVQEVIAARHAGMEVIALSVITDLGIVEGDNHITHEEVLQAAREAEPRVTTLFKALIQEW